MMSTSKERIGQCKRWHFGILSTQICYAQLAAPDRGIFVANASTTRKSALPGKMWNVADGKACAETNACLDPLDVAR